MFSKEHLYRATSRREKPTLKFIRPFFFRRLRRMCLLQKGKFWNEYGFLSNQVI